MTKLLVHLKALTLTGETIQVKLTGDGTNIARSIHVVNLPLLYEGSAASSSFGNYSLDILQGPEDYNSLLISLSDIVKEASELRSMGWSIILNTSWEVIKNFLLLCVALKQQMQSMHVFGASVPAVIGGL